MPLGPTLPRTVSPAEALPSDPDWAGEIVYTDVRSLLTPVDQAEL